MALVSSALTETLSAFGTTPLHRFKKRRLRNFSGAAVVNTTKLLWAGRWRSFFGLSLSVLWSFLAALACRRLPATSRLRSARLRIGALSRSSHAARFAGGPTRRWRIARLI